MRRSKDGRDPKNFYEADVLANNNDHQFVEPLLPIPQDLDDRSRHLSTVDSRSVTDDDKFQSRLNRLTALDINDERYLRTLPRDLD